MDLRLLAKHIGVLYPVFNRIRKIRYVHTLEDLDRALAPVMAQEEPSREALNSLGKTGYAPKDMPTGDPSSPAFTDAQWKLYRDVSGRASYGLENEVTPMDEEKVKDDFFPYSTRSQAFVGESLMKQGFLVKHMRIAPESRIVEFGAGWGNTAVPLAMMHHKVTAVEAHHGSAELIRHRAGRIGRSITVVEADMMEFARSTPEKFEAAIFSASFHHCWDHLEMVKALARIVVPGGEVYFSDEPIHFAINPGLPYPWGLRLDGNSLYYVRRYGWLELGFQYSYLKKILRENGFTTRVVPSGLPDVPPLVVARRNPLP